MKHLYASRSHPFIVRYSNVVIIHPGFLACCDYYVNPRQNLLTYLRSHGLVKTYGPDDMRTELKDVSVFRMDVHMPEAPQARLQATLRTYCGLECPIIRSPIVPRCPHTSTGRADTFFYRQTKQSTRFFITSPGSGRYLSQLSKDPMI